MVAELQERQAAQVTLERGIATREPRTIWPVLVAVVALAALVGAGVLFFSEDAEPLRIDPLVIEQMNTGVREGGEYALPGVASLADPTTAAREGGEYSAQVTDTTTPAREGGEYATP